MSDSQEINSIMNINKIDNLLKIEENSIFFEIDGSSNEPPVYNENVIKINNDLKISNLNFGKNFNYSLQDSPNNYSISWGCPIVNNRDNPREALDIILTNNDKLIENIDGQFLFLIINKETNNIKLISDRFNGINLFYALHNKKLICSSSYFLLAKRLKHLKIFEWADEIIYDLIRMNRVFGYGSYDLLSKFLPPGIILQSDLNKIDSKFYWKPSFRKKYYKNVSEVFSRYCYLLKKSTSQLIDHIRDKDIILFLSGGHDSRSLLSVVNRKLTCFTIAYKRNKEVNIAQRCAMYKKQKFVFFKLPTDHIIYHFDEAVKISGGFHSFIDAFYLGIGRDTIRRNSIAINGHGLDYFFQGSYLPTEWIYLFGRPTFFKKKRNSKVDFPESFINNVPYRVKGVDVNSFIKSEYRNKIYDNLAGRIDKISKKYTDFNSSEFDKWDMLLIDTLGRHYSRPNIDSQNLICQIRIPAFSNKLFEFCLSLPISFRINGFLPRKLLSKSGLGKIPTSNWLFPASDSPLIKTIKLILRKILRDLLSNPNISGPNADDRTFPDLNNFLINSLELQNIIRNCIRDEVVRDRLQALDWDRVEKLFIETVDGKIKGAQFLFALASISRFIQMIEE